MCQTRQTSSKRRTSSTTCSACVVSVPRVSPVYAAVSSYSGECAEDYASGEHVSDDRDFSSVNAKRGDGLACAILSGYECDCATSVCLGGGGNLVNESDFAIEFDSGSAACQVGDVRRLLFLLVDVFSII